MQAQDPIARIAGLERALDALGARVRALEPIVDALGELDRRVLALEQRPEPDSFIAENKLSINGEGKVE